MRNEKIEDIAKRISKEDMYHWYIEEGLSKEKCGKQLGICVGTVKKLLEMYGIVKSAEQQASQKAKNLSENRGHLFKEVLGRMPKEEVYDLYINQNKSYAFLLSHYNIKSYMLDKVLNHYGIHKSRKQSSSIVLETKYNAYGGKKAYDKMVAEKSVQFKIEKYGSLEEYYAMVQQKVKETYEKKYGSRRYYNVEAMRKTCNEKYGVGAPCMLPQARMHGNNSAPNRAFAKLLDEHGIEYTREFPLGQYSYDFKVGNILIEIDPSATHNSTWSPFGTPHDKSYHYSKSVCAEQNGFRCIHVFDWDDYEKILMLIESGTREVIYARNCTIGDVSEAEAIEFINKYHLQGYAKDSIRIGLYCGDRLVSIMTFGKPRYNKHFDYELIRYCSCANVVGGAEKLFKYFIKEHSNCSIISYCDYAKFSGDLYEKLRFKNKGCSVSKHWYELESGMHITDNLLRQRGFDQLFGTNFGKGTSNEELMIACGFVEVYDCGQIRFEYER